MSQINIAKLVAEGKTAEQINAIVAAAVEVETAKNKLIPVPTLQEIGARIARGQFETADAIVLVIDFVKTRIPEVAEFGDLDITSEDLTELVEIIDIALEAGRKEIVPQIELAKMLGVDPKDIFASKKDLSPADATEFLKRFKQGL